MGEGKRRIGITLNQLVDGEAPAMKNPIVWIDGEWFSITDPIMKDDIGRQMVIKFKIDLTDNKYNAKIEPL